MTHTLTEKTCTIRYQIIEEHVTTFPVNIEELNDLFLLVDYLSDFMDECYNEELMKFDNQQIANCKTEQLKVWGDDVIVFDSLEDYKEFQKEFNIQKWVDSDLCPYITINDIRYRGEIEKGMLAQPPIQ